MLAAVVVQGRRMPHDPTKLMRRFDKAPKPMETDQPRGLGFVGLAGNLFE